MPTNRSEPPNPVRKTSVPPPRMDETRTDVLRIRSPRDSRRNRRKSS